VGRGCTDDLLIKLYDRTICLELIKFSTDDYLQNAQALQLFTINIKTEIIYKSYNSAQQKMISSLFC